MAEAAKKVSEQCMKQDNQEQREGGYADRQTTEGEGKKNGGTESCAACRQQLGLFVRCAGYIGRNKGVFTHRPLGAGLHMIEGALLLHRYYDERTQN